jgi:hypothetical protein
VFFKVLRLHISCFTLAEWDNVRPYEKSGFQSLRASWCGSAVGGDSKRNRRDLPAISRPALWAFGARTESLHRWRQVRRLGCKGGCGGGGDTSSREALTRGTEADQRGAEGAVGKAEGPRRRRQEEIGAASRGPSVLCDLSFSSSLPDPEEAILIIVIASESNGSHGALRTQGRMTQ